MLLYAWDRELDMCVNLTGSSPLTQTGMADLAPSRAVIDAAQCKHVKHEAKKRVVIFQVQRGAISEAKREDIRKHGIESYNKILDGDHEVDLQQALRILPWIFDSQTSCLTTRTGPMPMQAFVELLKEGIYIPAWLAFNSKDGVNVISDDSLAEMPIVLTLLILTIGLAFMLSMDHILPLIQARVVLRTALGCSIVGSYYDTIRILGKPGFIGVEGLIRDSGVIGSS
nr:homocysteine S-methyltransferase 2-like [Tanacetum cinerariifolium]